MRRQSVNSKNKSRGCACSCVLRQSYLKLCSSGGDDDDDDDDDDGGDSDVR